MGADTYVLGCSLCSGRWYLGYEVGTLCSSEWYLILLGCYLMFLWELPQVMEGGKLSSGGSLCYRSGTLSSGG